MADIEIPARLDVAEQREEWVVDWFPPGSGDKSKTYTDEKRALDRYAVAEELGHFPILSRKVILVLESEVIKNSAAIANRDD